MKVFSLYIMDQSLLTTVYFVFLIVSVLIGALFLYNPNRYSPKYQKIKRANEWFSSYPILQSFILNR